jgi:ribosomal protein L6P/L9E
MSRIGKNPIVLPAGVVVTVGEQISVKGPLGTLMPLLIPLSRSKLKD